MEKCDMKKLVKMGNGDQEEKIMENLKAMFKKFGEEFVKLRESEEKSLYEVRKVPIKYPKIPSLIEGDILSNVNVNVKEKDSNLNVNHNVNLNVNDKKKDSNEGGNLVKVGNLRKNNNKVLNKDSITNSPNKSKENNKMKGSIDNYAKESDKFKFMQSNEAFTGLKSFEKAQEKAENKARTDTTMSNESSLSSLNTSENSNASNSNSGLNLFDGSSIKDSVLQVNKEIENTINQEFESLKISKVENEYENFLNSSMFQQYADNYYYSG